MCDCRSYNQDTNGKAGAVLKPPYEFGIKTALGEPKESVVVDACIAGVIQHLWDSGVVTLNSCCGHGKRSPAIILDDDTDPTDARRIRQIIAQVDSRDFRLLSWRLVDV